MKDKKIKIIDEEGEKLCVLLQKFGYNQKESKVLAFMLENAEGISRDIEQGTGLRQPETSIGLRKLAKADYMKRESIGTSKKGRPIFRYTFNMSIDKFKESLREKLEGDYVLRKKDLNEVFVLLDRLRGKHVA